MTELPIVHRVGHVPLTRSRLWWCEWHKRTGIGAIDESRVRYQSWTRACPQHDRCDSGTTRDGAGTGAEPEDDVEGVSKPALGDDCGHGFLHCGSVDTARLAAVRGSVLHRLGYTQGGSCRDCTIGERVVDEPNCPQSHGFGGRNPDRKTVLDSRP